MKTKFTILFSALLVLSGIKSSAQSFQNLDTIKPPAEYENIYSRQVYSDSLETVFVIYIKKQVKLHKHITHTEIVVILEGEGEMTVGDKKFKVKKDDIISIPKGTPHSLVVTSATPVKVLSIQSPFFDGKDRVFIEN